MAKNHTQRYRDLGALAQGSAPRRSYSGEGARQAVAHFGVADDWETAHPDDEPESLETMYGMHVVQMR